MQQLSSNDGEVIQFRQVGQCMKISHVVVNKAGVVVGGGKNVKLEIVDARIYYKGYKDLGYTKL